mgnify:CR=1 FL=1
MIGTLFPVKKSNSVAKSRQYRWEHFLPKKSYQNLQKNTMWQSLICSANKHSFLVDKVKATKKIAWVHNEYSQLGHVLKKWTLSNFAKSRQGGNDI